MTLEFFVRGIPRPQGSKRHVGRGIMVESSKGLKTWRGDVRDVAISAAASQGWGLPAKGTPISIRTVFAFDRPETHLRSGGIEFKSVGITVRDLAKGARVRPTGKPDTDKLLRAIGDALATVVYHDDSPIVEAHAYKVYTRVGAGVFVQVKPADEVVVNARSLCSRLGFEFHESDIVHRIGGSR